nr:hypothetical protein [Tanacetum cinerariifolium]
RVSIGEMVTVMVVLLWRWWSRDGWAAGEGDGRRRVAEVGVNGGGDEGGRWWMRDGDGLEVRREVVWLSCSWGVVGISSENMEASKKFI